MLHERCIFVKDIKKHHQMATRLGREVATPSIFEENLSRYSQEENNVWFNTRGFWLLDRILLCCERK